MTSITQGILRDNGCRSFVPPCYKWDIIDPATEKVVEVASDIDLSQLNLSEEQAVQLYSEFARGLRTVEGYTTTYTVGTSAEHGVRLVVSRLCDVH